MKEYIAKISMVIPGGITFYLVPINAETPAEALSHAHFLREVAEGTAVDKLGNIEVFEDTYQERENN